MTHALAFPMHGMSAMQLMFQRHALIGLMLASCLYIAGIGAYYTASLLQADEDIPLVRIRIYKPTDLPPPPTILPNAPVAANFITPAKTDFGTPVPIPDAMVTEAPNFPTQTELSTLPSNSLSDKGGTGSGKVEFENKINIEEEPSLEAFVAVEKMPVPVVQITPTYPEIARRAGVEGTVWVKVLVGKDGKVKKAVVVKSDAEIFDAEATHAALQWVFTPAVMNSGPVVVWATVPFRFALNKK